MSLTRQVAHNTIIQVGGKIVGTLLGLIIAAILFRYLKDFGYGQYTTILTYLQLFGIVMDLGLFVVLINRIAPIKDQAEENRIINNTFTFRLFTGSILLIIAVLISWLIPQYSTVIKLGILVTAINFLFISLSQILTAIFQKHLAMAKVAWAEIGGKIILLLSTLAAVFMMKAGILMVMLTVVLGSLTNFLMLYWGARQYCRLKLAFNFPVWRELWHDSWPIALSISLNMIYFKADTLLLGLFRTQNEVGIYGSPYKILEVIITIPGMFVGLVLPSLSASFQEKNMDRFRQLFQKAFDALVIMVAPIIGGAMVVAQPLMVLIAGEKFSTNIDDLGRVLQILIWAVGSIFVGTLTGYLVVVVKKQRAAIWAYAFVALTALIGYLFLIPKYSYFGAAAVTVYSEFAMMFLTFYLIYQVTKIIPNLNTLAKAAGASFLMAASIYFFRDWPVIFSIILGGLIYMALIYFFRGITKQEILEIIRPKKNA
jgi:O-antigen/teichoic acid export membrane protein